MTKKLPQQIDLDELLKIVKEPPKLTNAIAEENQVLNEDPVHKDVLTFMSRFNILPGPNRVKKGLLFNIYKAWSADPIKRKEFIQICNKYLPTSGSGQMYSINANVVKLSYDVYTTFKRKYRIISNRSQAVHFENFLNYYSLKKEDYWIHINILYFLYDKYLYEKKVNKPLAFKHFEHHCKVYLQIKNTTNGKLVLLSKNIENFFQEGQLERMKVTYAEERKKEIQEAKEPKRKRSKPKSKSKV